jgi:hypothetical protein
MSDAFDKGWSVVKYDDGEEMRLIRHIVSMVMGMTDDMDNIRWELPDDLGRYLEGMKDSGRQLHDLTIERHNNPEHGKYMRDDELDSWIDAQSNDHMADDDELWAMADADDDEAFDERVLQQFPFQPKPSNMYEPPMMLRGEMAELMQSIQNATPEQLEAIRAILG